MKIFCRILLFVFLLFITLSSKTLCYENVFFESQKSDTISFVRYYNQDIISSKDNENVLSNINRNDRINFNNKTSDNNSNETFNGLYTGVTAQYKCLLAYLYTQSYLENKSKHSFSSSLSEILPNAP